MKSRATLERPLERRLDQAIVGLDKPLVSVVVPAFNEAEVLEENLAAICDYLDTLSAEYRWELIVVNDGSSDRTGELAERFAAGRENVRVLHHRSNFGLGQAFQYAFRSCRGDYVVTLDMDLSYSADHIASLLSRIRSSGARVVAASPYMSGGRISNVPWLRRTLSIWANRFLSIAARGNLSTLTSMVRVYDGRFLRRLSLRSMGMEISPEIIYKTMLLHGRIEEMPAHLNWSAQRVAGYRRRSSMKILRHTLSVLLSGFLFRPVMFFILPGLLLLLLSVYANGWALAHSLEHWAAHAQYTQFTVRASAAVASAFNQAPHTFVVGGITLMLAIQLIGLGILALQSKSYFEEIFHLGSTIGDAARELRDPRV